LRNSLNFPSVTIRLAAKPIILIDADILLYKALTAAEKEVEWSEDLWSMWVDLGDARVAFMDQLKVITEVVPGAEPYLCLTDAVNFRKTLDPTYKAHRKKQRKPMCFGEFKQWVIDEYQVVQKPTLEADDCIGILGTKPGNTAFIHSGDKDLKQIPGQHIVDGKVITITEEQATHLFYMQTLTGDTADGYPGCPGIGKVTAEKLLKDGEPWPAIVSAYESKGLTEADALLQARLARILRWDDWDNKTQEVKLWVPTK
jgi:DNA polymerase-1